MQCRAAVPLIALASMLVLPIQAQVITGQSAAPQPAPATTQQTPTGLYRIAGFVLSALDSRPLQNAAVQIQPSSGGPGALQKTTTDENGYFVFTGVPAGMFNLQGSAPGYLPTTYEQHGAFSTGIVTGAGVDTESLVLKLQPQASLSITVIDEAGDPVQHATVHLFRDGHNFGEDRRISVGTNSTNDLGRVDFPRLQPGTFYAAVQAQPWYAMHPRPETGAFPPGAAPEPISFGFVPAIDPAVDVAYPITYYPDVTDPARAGAIQIRGGDALDLQIQLRPEPAVSITIPLPPEADQERQRDPGAPPPARMRNVPFPQVSTSMFGQSVGVGANESLSPNGREIVITGLAPGDYTLSEPRNSGALGNGTPLHLNGRSVSAALPSDESMAHLTVHVKTADGGPLPAGTQIMLMRDRRFGPSQALDSKGAASWNSMPGDYSFHVNPSQGRMFFVSRVSRGEQPLPSNDIHLSAGESASFVVTVSAGTHTLRGVTQVDGKPAHGIFVLLVPTAELHNIHTAFRYQSDLDGSFQIAGVPPGDYTLVAIQDGWSVNWDEPAVLNQYLSGATTVRISEGSPAIQTLPTPITVQAR